MSEPLQFRSIDDLERGGREVVPSKSNAMWTYVSAWFLIIWLSWSVIVGSIILYRFSEYFCTKKGYQHSRYDRGAIDNTSYLTIFMVSIIVGLFLTVITMWILSFFQKSNKKM